MNNLTYLKLLFVGLILSILVAVASFSLVKFFENKTLGLIYQNTLDTELNWLDVSVDGTKVIAHGIAPDESSRYVAIAIISSIINPKRLVDEIIVKKQIIPLEHRYFLEFSRDDSYITAIGFVPSIQYSDDLILRLESIIENAKVTNLLDSSTFQLNSAWYETVDFAIQSMKALPNSKITITNNEISVFALSAGVEDKIRIQNKLQDLDPGHFKLNLEIKAPRSLIQPFTLALTKNSNHTYLSKCSASDELSKALILDAVAKLGVEDLGECKVGIGAPSENWSQAAIISINYVKKFENALLKLENNVIDIVVSENTGGLNLKESIGVLKKQLPSEFIVNATIEAVSKNDRATNDDFIANLNTDGVVQMKGFLPDQNSRIAVTSYARSIFGLESVRSSVGLNDELPKNLSMKVLAGLEVLGALHDGILIVKDNKIYLEGQSANPEINEIATDMLSKKLASNILPTLNLKYDESLLPKPKGPNPQECVLEINNIIKTYGIEFAPGEIVLQKSSNETLDRVAEVMQNCYIFPMEIGGHTDSQGRKSLNLSISQARAEAVMDSLLSYDILTGNLVAKGFGESTPIADNKTVAGRNRNRRIEFTLINSNN